MRSNIQIGNTYNQLTVLEFIGKSKFRELLYKCSCSCGNTTTVVANKLVKGSIKSCGHLRIEHARNLKLGTKLPDRLAVKRKLYNELLGNAAKRNLDVAISLNQFLFIINTNCFYCGASPKSISRTTNNVAETIEVNGIDRIDSSQGYIPSNIVSCCTDCNHAKFELSFNDFIDLVKNQYNHLKSKGYIKEIAE